MLGFKFGSNWTSGCRDIVVEAVIALAACTNARRPEVRRVRRLCRMLYIQRFHQTLSPCALTLSLQAVVSGTPRFPTATVPQRKIRNAHVPIHNVRTKTNYPSCKVNKTISPLGPLFTVTYANLACGFCRLLLPCLGLFNVLDQVLCVIQFRLV
jgi:hypothetical protein